MVSVGITSFMLWYWNVENDGIIGTQFPLGLRGNVESVNYSLLGLEKSNSSFNQGHITNLFLENTKSKGQLVCLFCLIQASSPC